MSRTCVFLDKDVFYWLPGAPFHLTKSGSTMGKRTLFHCGLTADERFLHFAPHDDDTPDAFEPIDLCKITGLDTEESAGQSKLSIGTGTDTPSILIFIIF